MPLLRKQPFVRNQPPTNLQPESEVFYCEATKEVFTNYDNFFQRTILCNSLVWSCSVTGKSNLTFEEALESEEKAKKRIGNLTKPLKRGILWLARHTKRGRLVEVSDDVNEFARQRYFKGEIIEAVISDQWCDAKITKVIPPTQAEIDADNENEDDEITEVDADGSPKKDAGKPPPARTAVPDHLFKYEVEEVEPDDEDMVMLHIIPAEDCKREKGVFTKDKLNLYLKNVVELDGMHFKVKAKVSKMYDLEKIRFEDIFAGPPPTFAETQNKKAVMNKNKKGQFTLDGWIKDERVAVQKGGVQKVQKVQPVKEVKPVKIKQTPEELEAEMKKMRERQARYKEEMRVKMEKEKVRRAEERVKEKERKKEEQRIVKELLQEWSRRRDDLECEDLKELPKPSPVRCHIPNKMFGDFVSILEFLNSFTDSLALKDTYPGGLTFAELETALTEKEVPDGAFFDILSFMLITVFDLQTEEIEEAKADNDARMELDETDKNIVGKEEDVAQGIIEATKLSNYTKKNLGLALRECHVDVWSLTEILRLHLEASGGYRGHSLQVWRYMQRGGYRLQDDPGFQFCRDEPQILVSLQETIVTELAVGDKLKILNVLMTQMLTYAGLRDELDTRLDNMIEAGKELKDAVIVENRRIREQVAADKLEKREEMLKRREEILKEQLNRSNQQNNAEEGKEAPKVAPVVIKETMTDRQREAKKEEEEKKEKDKLHKEELRRAEFLDLERELQDKILDAQNQVYVHCLGRDRAYRRFWMFDALPGIFVEHEDDEIGGCLEVVTPWNPEASRPITEAEALEKAKEILAQSNRDEDGELTVNISEVPRTFKPALKQQTLTANGQLTSNKDKDAAKVEAKPETDNKAGDTETKAETGEDKPKVNGVNGEEVNGVDGEEEQETEEVKELNPPWGRCEGNQDSCPVHSSILPKTHWAFYSTVEQLDELIEGLNPRGVREGELRDRLIAEREHIEGELKKAASAKSTAGLLSKTEEDLSKEEERALEAVRRKREKNSKWGGAMALPVGTDIKDIVEISLRDQILELEEKIFMGSLGALRVADRKAWQTALETRGYLMGCEELVWAGGNKMAVEQLTAEPTTSGSPDSKRSSGASAAAFNTVVRQLAAAILQVGQMINDSEKYMKSPLAEDEKDRKKRQAREEKQRKDRETEEEEGVVCETKSDAPLTPFQRWEQSLMACTSVNQLFLHLTTLDNSVVWSKSIMNTKCRICRRKTDPEKMLLCDGCDRGHHIFCLKPKLKSIPKDDWFCSDCKPKERIRSPKKKVRRVFSSTEESEDEDEVRPEVEKEKDDESGMEDDEDDEIYNPAPKKKPKEKKQPKAKKKILQEPEPEPESSKKTKKKGIAGLLGKRKVVEEEDEDVEEEEQEEEEEEEELTSRRTKRGKVNYSEDEGEEEEEEEEEEKPSKRGKRKSRANSEEKEDVKSSRRSGRKNKSRVESDDEEEEEEVVEKPTKRGKRNKSRVNSEEEEEEEVEKPTKRGKRNKEEENKENSRSKRRRGDLDDSIELQFNVSGLEDLIKGLLASKDGWPFDRPITKADAPDYHKVIKNPMDLGTIKSRLNGLKYSCNQEVLDDIRLVFTNCIQYNMDDAEEYQCALRLQKVFNKEIAKMGLAEAEPEKPKSKKRNRRTF